MPRKSSQSPNPSSSIRDPFHLRADLPARVTGPFGAKSDLLKCWLGQGISLLGTQFSLIAVPIIAAVTLDVRPLALGILYACGQLPAILFGIFAGACPDRRKRRPVMVVADLARFVLTLTVPIVARFG